MCVEDRRGGRGDPLRVALDHAPRVGGGSASDRLSRAESPFPPLSPPTPTSKTPTPSPSPHSPTPPPSPSHARPLFSRSPQSSFSSRSSSSCFPSRSHCGSARSDTARSGPSASCIASSGVRSGRGRARRASMRWWAAGGRKRKMYNLWAIHTCCCVQRVCPRSTPRARLRLGHLQRRDHARHDQPTREQRQPARARPTAPEPASQHGRQRREHAARTAGRVQRAEGEGRARDGLLRLDAEAVAGGLVISPARGKASRWRRTRWPPPDERRRAAHRLTRECPRSRAESS